jgi:hypothetical protein
VLDKQSTQESRYPDCYPTCHRCGKPANYGYEISKDKTKYIGPIYTQCTKILQSIN